MTPWNCPNCGAPANVYPGQTVATCTYCKQSFPLAGTAPTPPPQPVQPIIVIAPGEPTPQSIAMPVRRAAGCGVVSALVPLVILGVVGFFVYGGLRAGGVVAGGWNGSETLVCGGNDSVEATGVSVSYASGAGINAGGNCHVKCTRCTIKGPIGVVAGGNAEVDLFDSHVEAPQAVVAGGNAHVRMLGSSSVAGQIIKSGNADVTAPPGTPTLGAPAPSPVPLQPHKPTR
jgi:hypothetical protein